MRSRKWSHSSIVLSLRPHGERYITVRRLLILQMCLVARRNTTGLYTSRYGEIQQFYILLFTEKHNNFIYFSLRRNTTILYTSLYGEIQQFYIPRFMEKYNNFIYFSLRRNTTILYTSLYGEIQQFYIFLFTRICCKRMMMMTKITSC